MRLSKNVQSRVVAVLVSLFLGFVMPWVLQANRDFRGEAQFKFDPSAMFASTVAEVLVSIVFAAVFVVSLLYLANQSNSRKLLLFAGVISLVAFAGFTMTYSLFVHGSVDGWIYYALSQMFLGLAWYPAHCIIKDFSLKAKPRLILCYIQIGCQLCIYCS